MTDSTLSRNLVLTRRRVVATMVNAPLLARNASADSGNPNTELSPGSRDIKEAISTSRSYLLNAQEPDCDYWQSNISMGQGGNWDVRLTLYYALLLEHLDVKNQSKQAAIDWTLRQRRSSGGWNDANANFAGLLLFRLLDNAQYNEVVADIKAENQRQGFSLVDKQQNFGENLRSNSPLRVKLLYLLLDDQYEREELVSKHATQRLMGLMKMTAAFDGDTISPTKGFVHEPFINLILATGAILALTDDQTERIEAMVDLTTELLLGRRGYNGTWGMSIEQLFSMFALSGVGYSSDDSEIARPLNYLVENWQQPSGRLVPYKIPVFDTAWALRALHASGVNANSDVMTDAAQWLFNARIATPLLTRENVPLDPPRPRPPFREYWGDGWGFKPYDVSDWDDTAVAIYAWGPYDERAIQGDIEFLLSVQRPNGTWGTWHANGVQALSSDDRQRIIQQFGHDFWENVSWLFSDPGVVEVTGHALLALGEHGHTVDNSNAAQRAVNWLFDKQGETVKRSDLPAKDGLWITPRGPEYIYATSRALLGMEAVGVNMDRPEIQAAVSRLIDKQRSDGSWGEPRIGPVQTARTLRALLVADIPPDHPAIESGVQYLLKTQRDDGSWNSGKFMLTITGRPYTLPVFVQAEALEALVRYADARDIPYEPNTNTSWFDISERELPGMVILTTLFALAATLLGIRQRK